MSSMTSFVRPIVISLLCGMAAIGHAPAWLHVACCDHESHRQVASASASTDARSCGHSCCHHATAKTDSNVNEAASEDSSQPHEGHDSDSCLICQSLGLPNGIAWHLDSPSTRQEIVELINVSSVIAPESASLSIPQPRGPPTPLA